MAVFNEQLVSDIELFIKGYGSKFKARITAYNEHMKRKIIKGSYNKEKALIGYRRYTEDGIRLYLLQFQNECIYLEDKEEVAERLESFYHKRITYELKNNEE